MDTILIIKTGSTLPALSAKRGDFEDWVVSGLGVGRDHIRVVDVCKGELLPRLTEVAGVVITGSHAMVTDHHGWSERTAAWLKDVVAEELPTLGICYGHQLLAYALGGEVGDNPQGHEFGTVAVCLSKDAASDLLLGGFRSPIRVHVSHVQSVLRLPEEATLLGWSDGEPHQAFVVGKCAWGVQFHPEFDTEVVRTYVTQYRATLEEEGADPDAIIANSENTPYGGEILQRFAEIVADRSG